METFRRVRPSANLGLFTGKEEVGRADVLFASVLTLARHLNLFAPEHFDYVVIDEFHHAAASSYRRVIDHFVPKFLLGLTATPERTDGGDLLALCEENLVFRCDLAEGVAAGLLSPFHYFGVPDEVDYRNIPWRNRRFDTDELTKAVATRARAENAFEQHRLRAGSRTLAFCCSTLHANFMRDFFRDAGLRTAAVHSDASTSDLRAGSLERLERGELDIVFAVDMFNEGIDVPDIDTIMMLRPTESRILWLQQFGRGLRKVEGKTLKIIDYIGNHRIFLLKPQMLLNTDPGDAGLLQALNLLVQHKANLPPGCEVTYDLEAIDILKSLLRLGRGDDAARFFYEEFRETNGSRPTATEMYHEGYNPRSLRRSYNSWLGFVRTMGDLDADQKEVAATEAAGDFLREIETTPMTKSYKMLVLRALLDSDSLPGELPVGTLARGVRHTAMRSARLHVELAGADDDNALTELLERNPIEAWVGGKGTGGRSYFEYNGHVFRSTFQVHESLIPAFRELVRELVDWRLAEYLDRQPTDGEPGVDSFVCRVSQASGRPMLFLPDRERVSLIPEGWTGAQTDVGLLEFNFVKVAVNVARRPGMDENVLPDLLQKWFGERAGQPGTLFQVRFEQRHGTWNVVPIAPKTPGEPEIGRSYLRAEIPPLFGLDARGRLWDQGFLREGGHIFLLVTLQKEGMPSAHQYQDRFLTPELFEWKSQNRTSRASAAGQSISNHAGEGVAVHLFVRKSGKLGEKAAPFLYCGTLQFQRWEGDKPITVWWRLETPLSPRMAELFDVPSPERR
jgi:superfamily II DNA or RNA helicase